MVQACPRGQATTSTHMNTEKQPGKQQGVDEAKQDRKQEDAAKARPGQKDESVRQSESRRPPIKDNPDA